MHRNFTGLPLADLFRGKTVLLTGHTGFKGSWLTLWLKQLGARVVGYACEPPTSPSHFEVAGVGNVIDRSVVADVRDLDRLSGVIQEEQPNLVLHLAAQSVVRHGYESPVETFSTNVMGTVNVLESVRTLRRPMAVLVVTSDKCYENREQIWGYRECDAMGDHCPYGGSKGAAELVVRSYQHSFFPVQRLAEHGVWLASARAGNVIGGGDWTDAALIVDTVAALSAGEPVSLRNPFAVRPWQHVLQCLSGYLTIASELLLQQRPEVCSGWNIGPSPGGELTVQEVVERFIHYWGEGEWQAVGNVRAPREAGILRLSIDKALTALNWRPIWNVERTLEMTAQWYRHYAQSEANEPEDIRALSLRQIRVFEEDMARAMPGQLLAESPHHSELGTTL
jgi:CDP-glucose 4,6-dehydratase